jgi:hypothetical protein
MLPQHFTVVIFVTSGSIALFDIKISLISNVLYMFMYKRIWLACLSLRVVANAYE